MGLVISFFDGFCKDERLVLQGVTPRWGVVRRVDQILGKVFLHALWTSEAPSLVGFQQILSEGLAQPQTMDAGATRTIRLTAIC